MTLEDLILVPHFSIDSVRECAAALNLKVLRGLDPLIVQVLATAPTVTLYACSNEPLKWFKTNVEGPLFVVERSTAPKYKMFILNRQSAEDIVVDLLDDYELQVLGQLLVFENASHEYTGIWFLKREDLEEVHNLLVRILDGGALKSSLQSPSSTTRILDGGALKSSLQIPSSTTRVIGESSKLFGDDVEKTSSET